MRPLSDPDSAPESHTGTPAADSPRGGRASLSARAAVAGGLTELAWVGVHLLTYPLGTRTEQLRLDPRLRPGAQSPAVRALFAADPLAARTPVLLVHGLVDNRSTFAVMRRHLRRRGFTTVCSWNYSPFLTDVARGARDLGKHIERICRETGHDQVHIVGHSLGGLMARYYVQRQGGDRRVATLVTIGTPHRGTVLANIAPTSLIRQLRPGSPVIRELELPAPGLTTRMTAIYSDMDQLVLPSPAGRCDHPDLHARNLLVRGVGHMSLLIHRAVLDEVVGTLTGIRRGTGPSAAQVHAVA
jgi:pimeloyl-ACP methyl ester carboxylesterase